MDASTTIPTTLDAHTRTNASGATSDNTNDSNYADDPNNANDASRNDTNDANYTNTNGSSYSTPNPVWSI
tara:strand:+ start:316 stop:525 length:210 start_codon:yes stop_codon:yes gene_type:complete